MLGSLAFIVFIASAPVFFLDAFVAFAAAAAPSCELALVAALEVVTLALCANVAFLVFIAPVFFDAFVAFAAAVAASFELALVALVTLALGVAFIVFIARAISKQ